MTGALNEFTSKAESMLRHGLGSVPAGGAGNPAYHAVVDLDDDAGEIPPHEDIYLNGSANDIRKDWSRRPRSTWTLRGHGLSIYAALVTVVAVVLYLRSSPSLRKVDTDQAALVPPVHYDLPWISTDGGRPAQRKAVVIGSSSTENAFWPSRIPSDWEVLFPPNASYPVTALSYLDWIIENYQALPAYVVFARGDDESWHQRASLTDVLRALDLAAVEKHGWLNLRCSLSPYCTPSDTWVSTDSVPPGDDWMAYLVRGIHSHLYRKDDIWFPAINPLPDTAGLPIPPVFASPAGSQFVVSREKIWSKPLAFWIRAREPLRYAPEEMDWWWPGETFTADQVEQAYERLWHYLFLGKPVVCLEENYCHQVLFQGHIDCGKDDLTPESSQEEVDSVRCVFKEKDR